jgi:hypothetical protein
MGGGPSGLPVLVTLSARLKPELFAFLALLLAVSRRPPEIQFLSRVTCASGSLSLLGGHLVEEAGAGIAGRDALATAAALEQVAVGAQVEAALGLVRVMAGHTGALHEGEDVVVPGNFGGGFSGGEESWCQ